jgi:hypothetical protein
MKKLISKVIKPNGRIVVKTGSYKWVLISGDRDLNKWSNKKENLEKEIRFLVNNGWDETELTILETEIGL